MISRAFTWSCSHHCAPVGNISVTLLLYWVLYTFIPCACLKPQGIICFFPSGSLPFLEISYKWKFLSTTVMRFICTSACTSTSVYSCVHRCMGPKAREDLMCAVLSWGTYSFDTRSLACPETPAPADFSFLSSQCWVTGLTAVVPDSLWLWPQAFMLAQQTLLPAEPIPLPSAKS